MPFMFCSLLIKFGTKCMYVIAEMCETLWLMQYLIYFLVLASPCVFLWLLSNDSYLQWLENSHFFLLNGELLLFFLFNEVYICVAACEVENRLLLSFYKFQPLNFVSKENWKYLKRKWLCGSALISLKYRDLKM